MGKKNNIALFNSKKQLMKACSQDEDWIVFKDMLLNLKLAVAVEPRPDTALRHLARTWVDMPRYSSPVCRSTLIKLSALKKANNTLEELIDLYTNLEEGNQNEDARTDH